jgi:hypothetical protein
MEIFQSFVLLPLDTRDLDLYIIPKVEEKGVKKLVNSRQQNFETQIIF